jgi:hypothetical protein
MLYRRIALSSILAVVAHTVLPVMPAAAIRFPDVGEGHIYRIQIEALAERDVVRGNPDGTYRPANTVNRAEMLTLLYRAQNRSFAHPMQQCKKDVPRGSWFEGVVCDAVTRGFAGGYPDGTFKPEQAVNRVEALKMIHTVFGMAVDAAAPATPLTAYEDVDVRAWYAPYMANAFVAGILPVAGREPPRFGPAEPLTRGEAAAYIFNALGLTAQEDASSSAATSRPRASQASSATAPTVLDINFPFTDDGVFAEKDARLYRFSLPSAKVAKISVTADADDVACRLYKLEKDTSFTFEYYIGHRIGRSCSMRVALGSGDYQLEVIPGKSNDRFVLASQIVAGDNNDGFRDAILLKRNSPQVGYLETEDFAEFYTFTVKEEEALTVEVSNATRLRCAVYPMADVDQYGFSGPVCNAEYVFQPGTYVVGVQLRDGIQTKESFSVRYR